MAQLTSEQIAEGLDMMTRMQFIERIDNSLNKMSHSYAENNFKTIDIGKLQKIADAFENLVKAFEDKEEE